LFGADGKIASELAIGAEALLRLASQPAEETRLTFSPSDGEREKTDGEDRTNRFRNRSLERSKLKRDGLKAGTVAPEFRLTLLDGGELSLAELRGRPVFLVLSSPHCGPCNTLAPRLEKFHRKYPELQVVMISRGEAAENREKVEEYGLSFPVALQKQWEISRHYAIFASPVAYLIDSSGVITADVAVGVDRILELMTRVDPLLRQNAGVEKTPLLKRIARWPVALTAATLDRLLARVTVIKSGIDTFQLKRFKFVPRPDDIFIVTYPRSGTTWMQMILYQLTTDGSMEFTHIAEHSPWFERSAESDRGYAERAAPRVFKSHLPYRSIPKGPGGYIYVARDGRDVAVSYYNLYRSHNGYKGSFAEFFELFLCGKVMHGSWFEHVGGWWKHRHELNVLFLTYEELVADLEGCLRRIIAFCHLNVPPEKLPLILERCSFGFMKQHEDKFDPAVEALWQQGARLNSFIRAGRVGEGSRQLDEQQQARFNQAFQSQMEPSAFGWLRQNPLTQPVPAASFGSG
jgi:peroxiredoxin